MDRGGNKVGQGVCVGHNDSCIALPKHGEFIAYSTKRTVTFWDTSTHTQLGLIQHPQDIRSIALSPDDRFLAIGGEGGKITIRVYLTSL
jgi:WD40 repeat protein